MLQNVLFVLGAAASGKSRFAERAVIATHLRPVYVATAEARDAEMAAKIARHRTERGPGWRTIESPRDIVGPLRAAGETDALLVDCLTLWLTNVLLAGDDVEVAADELLGALRLTGAFVALVSNEVGAGIVPADALSRRFREAQGRLNAAVAAEAGTAVLVAAGLPLVLKGTMPRGIA